MTDRARFSATAIERLVDEPLDSTTKGLPFGGSTTLRSIADRGWNLFAGDLPFPLLVLYPDAIRHNIELMQGYATAHGALLAPHGKTTMAPQIWAQQLTAGAWGITVATASQLQVASAFGIDGILLANEPVTAYEARLLAAQIDAGREVLALVDDAEVVGRLASELGSARIATPLPLLIEMGMPKGRTGARDLTAVMDIATEIARHPRELRLAGVETFEATASALYPNDPVGAVDAVLERVLEAVCELDGVRQTDRSDQPFIVSAGGSGFFDRVVGVLGGRLPDRCQLLLRPGTYVTHDVGMYDAISPIGGGPAGRIPGPQLRPALTLWAEVLSRPEPEVVLVNAGRRDSPGDADAPRPRWRVPRDAIGAGHRDPARHIDPPATVTAMSDQHLFLRVSPDSEIRAGDVLGFGVSHPCLVLDRWRLVLLAKADGSIVGGIRTFF